MSPNEGIQPFLISDYFDNRRYNHKQRAPATYSRVKAQSKDWMVEQHDDGGGFVVDAKQKRKGAYFAILQILTQCK